MWSHKQMSEKIIDLFENNSSVNLGIGLPTKIAELIPEEKNIMIHSENGVLGVWGRPKKGMASSNLINAGKETISIRKGASFFDSSLSFGMIRGGHIDYSVLGGMQVDINWSLANWMVPGKKITGMGGAMDLVHGSKNVIVMMDHYTKDGKSKVVEKCSFPLTGENVIDLLVTNVGIFEPDKKRGKFKILGLSDKKYRDKLENGLFIK